MPLDKEERDVGHLAGGYENAGNLHHNCVDKKEAEGVEGRSSGRSKSSDSIVSSRERGGRTPSGIIYHGLHTQWARATSRRRTRRSLACVDGGPKNRRGIQSGTSPTPSRSKMVGRASLGTRKARAGADAMGLPSLWRGLALPETVTQRHYECTQQCGWWSTSTHRTNFYTAFQQRGTRRSAT